MLPEKNNSELEERFNHEQFRLKTQLQLTKDFGVHGFEFAQQFSENAYSIERLVDTVSEALMYMIEKQASSWHPLLYTMDVSEQTYLQLATSNEPNWMEEFTWVVLRREALKVFFREKYS
jgi:hypothetical protein